MGQLTTPKLKRIVENAGFEWERRLRPEKAYLQEDLTQLKGCFNVVDNGLGEAGEDCESFLRGQLQMTIDYGLSTCTDLIHQNTENVYEPRHESMTIWHSLAMAFSYYLAQKAGVYCLLELPYRNPDNEGKHHRIDCFIVPTEGQPNGLGIQWEPEYNKALEVKYACEWFPLCPDVIVFGYKDLWRSLLQELVWMDEIENTEELTWKLEAAAEMHQLPYPKKFKWHKWKKNQLNRR